MPLSREGIARKRAEFLKQNAAAVEAHRIGAAIYCGSVEAINKMLPFDRMPKPWRDLANEHGGLIVSALIEDGVSVEDASFALDNRRHARQTEWLKTNYVNAHGLREAFNRAIERSRAA